MIEVTDRYDALGIPHPDPTTVCEGQCEGTGVVPVQVAPVGRRGIAGPPEEDPELLRRWHDAEAKDHAADGWHFVTCPTCEGSGKRNPASVR